MTCGSCAVLLLWFYIGSGASAAVWGSCSRYLCSASVCRVLVFCGRLVLRGSFAPCPVQKRH